MDHALQYMEADGFIAINGQEIDLLCDVSVELREYLEDLLQYGLTRYNTEYEGVEDMFKLYSSYRMDQVQRKRCINPQYNAVGTYYTPERGEVFIFASIHKDASTLEHLNYNDRFLEPAVFQWESMADLPASDEKKLRESNCAYLFIRKMADENGITLPFTYVGKGKLTNPRVLPKQKRTMLFDIVMEHELPDYLQYDFIEYINKENHENN